MSSTDDNVAEFVGCDARAVTSDTFVRLVRGNQFNSILLERLPKLGLPQCWLTAGCLFQTVWNLRSGHPPEWGIKDYDVFYFDASDISWEAEDAIIKRANGLFDDFDITVELRNQARVHLWYPKKFGRPYPQLKCATDGIDRFLISCTCVGVEVATGNLYAPDGFTDLWHGRLRPNPLNLDQKNLFEIKAEDYRKRWPWLTIES